MKDSLKFTDGRHCTDGQLKWHQTSEVGAFLSCLIFGIMLVDFCWSWHFKKQLTTSPADCNKVR